MTQEAVAAQLVVGERARESRDQASAAQRSQQTTLACTADWTHTRGAFKRLTCGSPGRDRGAGGRGRVRRA